MKGVEAKKASLLRKIQDCSEMLQGSLVVLYRKCGTDGIKKEEEGMREEHAREMRAGEVEKEKTRRVRLKPINREQMVLRPMDIKALVPEDHEVRAIWKFEGRIDRRT